VIRDSHGQRLEWDAALGGRLISWQVHGHEVLAHHGDHPVEHGMYAMAPWSGRLLHNRVARTDMDRLGIHLDQDLHPVITYDPWALHGTCYTAPVDTVELSADSLVTRQVIPEWPWSAELISHWTLVPGGLDLRLQVTSDQPSPAIIGWHPWFRKDIHGAQAQWHAGHGRMALRGPDHPAFPDGQWRDLAEVSGAVDDAFVLPDRTVQVQWPGTLALTVNSSHPWFVIFDELPDAICVEPQTQLPNAWNSPWDGEADVVRPGHPLELHTLWRWRDLSV